MHTWEALSPFFNIAQMIDMMTLFIKIMLIAIVLMSVMNVMIMAVYERIREIGTIAAIGTLPGKILSMFVVEGFCLGILGRSPGHVGIVVIFVLSLLKISFNFGQADGLSCARSSRRYSICLLGASLWSPLSSPEASSRRSSIADGADHRVKTCIGFF